MYFTLKLKILNCRNFQLMNGKVDEVVPKVSIEVSEQRGSVASSPITVLDIVLLRFTLVMDQGVREGFVDELISLEPHILKAAARADIRNSTVTNSSVEVWLHSLRGSQQATTKEDTFAKN